MRARRMLSNVFLLSLPSLIVFFLLCEFAIFRLVPITEQIHQRFDGQWSMVTLTPNRSGTYIGGISRKLRYRAKFEGWNSLRVIPKHTRIRAGPISRGQVILGGEERCDPDRGDTYEDADSTGSYSIIT